MAFGYSVMLDLTGRRALVAGGGEVAARKIRRLLAAGAEVTVIAPAFCAEIVEDCARGLLRCERRAFQLADIAALDPFIVFAATDDAALNKAIAAYCDAARILVNAITDPQNGNFSVQAEIPRARYAVSVSTYGQVRGRDLPKRSGNISSLCSTSGWIWLLKSISACASGCWRLWTIQSCARRRCADYH